MTLQRLADGSLNPAWVACRRGMLGASRVADILRAGKGGKPSETRKTLAKQLAAERYAGHSCNNVNPNNPDIMRGNEMEPIALAEYESKRGTFLLPPQWINHPTLFGSGCTPDGITSEGGLVQVKAPRLDNFVSMVLEGEVPKDYRAQLTWEQAVTKAPWSDLVLYCREMPEAKRMWIKRFTATDEEIAEMEEQVRLFLMEVEAYFDALTKMEFA